MNRKILPIVTIVLAVGLFAFVWGVQKQEDKKAVQYEKMYEQRRPLTVKKEQIEQKLEELENAYEKSKAPNAITQVLFTEMDEQVYSLCYPIMQEYEYVGILALSPTEFPGEEGCMTVEQFQELMNAGWKICITWQNDTEVNNWLTNLQNKMTVLGIEQGQTMYFPQGTYNAELDATLQDLGFSIAVISKTEEETPLQLQYEEGVWHVGAVGLMSSKPRLWLREAVAQDANIAFLVGFQLETELFNERSFRSMLNCFDEYEATEELVITDVDVAKEYYHTRSAGINPELESQYQQEKAALEAELADVKKQLEEIEAMY